MRSLSTGPGESVLTRTPWGPASCARVVVSPITAIFDAQYGVRRASGRLPDTEATLTMSPAPRSYIPGSSARHMR
jgi:hypothetical protein